MPYPPKMPPKGAPVPHAEPDADEGMPPEMGDNDGDEGPSPDHMVGQEQKTTDDMVASEAGPAPAPASVVQVSAIQNLCRNMNALTAVITPSGTPPVNFAPPPGTTATKEALPDPVWLRLWTLGMIISRLSEMPGGEALKPYMFDTKEAATRQVTMNETASKLGRLARDKAAIKVFMDAAQKAKNETASAGPTPPPPPAP